MSVSVHGSGSIIGIDQGIQISGISTFQEGIHVTGGNVGIGTDNPLAPLTVADNGPACVDVHHMDGGTNDEARIILGALANNPPSNRGAGIAAVNNGAGHDLIIKCSPSHSLGPVEKLRVTSAGRLLLPTGSPGIQFGSPDNPALSGGIDISSQTLDDYEEGAWSAVLNYHTDNTNTSTTNGTIDANEAVYTKIGRMVYVTCTFAMASTANYVYKSVTGLPFTATSRSNLKIYVRGGVYRYASTAHEDAFFTGIIGATATYISLNSERTDTTSSGWIQARMVDQALSVSGCYLAS